MPGPLKLYGRASLTQFFHLANPPYDPALISTGMGNLAMFAISRIAGRCSGFGSYDPAHMVAGLNARHHHVLDLDILLEAVARAFAPQTAFLHTTEGRDFRRDQAGVDAHHAGFQGFGDAPHTAQIA